MTRRTALIPHTCIECLDPIAPGESHVVTRIGRSTRARTCLVCADTRRVVAYARGIEAPVGCLHATLRAINEAREATSTGCAMRRLRVRPEIARRVRRVLEVGNAEF